MMDSRWRSFGPAQTNQHLAFSILFSDILTSYTDSWAYIDFNGSLLWKFISSLHLDRSIHSTNHSVSSG